MDTLEARNKVLREYYSIKNNALKKIKQFDLLDEDGVCDVILAPFKTQIINLTNKYTNKEIKNLNVYDAKSFKRFSIISRNVVILDPVKFQYGFSTRIFDHIPASVNVIYEFNKLYKVCMNENSTEVKKLIGNMDKVRREFNRILLNDIDYPDSEIDFKKVFENNKYESIIIKTVKDLEQLKELYIKLVRAFDETKSKYFVFYNAFIKYLNNLNVNTSALSTVFYDLLTTIYLNAYIITKYKLNLINILITQADTFLGNLDGDKNSDRSVTNILGLGESHLDEFYKFEYKFDKLMSLDESLYTGKLSLSEEVTSKITKYSDNLKGYISGLLDKFISWIKQYTDFSSKYLTKYKDLIMQNEIAGFESTSCSDYVTAVQRISTYNPPSNIDNINGNQPKIDLYKALGIQLDQSTKDEDVDKAVYGYFVGGVMEERKPDYFQGAKQKLFDFCMNANDSVNQIKKLQQSISDELNRLTGQAKQQDENDQHTKEQAQEEKQEAKQKAQEDKQEAKQESTNLLDLVRLLEADGQNQQQQQDPNSPKTGGTAKIEKTDKNDPNSDQQQQQNNDEPVKGLPAEDDDVTSKLPILKALNNILYSNIRARERIMSDMMKIFKAHVNFYLNKAKNENSDQ